MLNRLIALALAGALSLGLISGAQASQGSGCMPTTGVVSGLQFALDINAAIAALISSNSGAAAPATDCSVTPIQGQVWLDTSVTPNALRQYDGVAWVNIGALDTSQHLWSPPVGGGLGSVSAAATTDLCAAPTAVLTVLGNTTITSFGASCVAGIRKTLVFAGSAPLIFNATSLIVPGQFSYTTSPGDVAEAVYLGTGKWRIVTITKIDGSAVTNPSIPLGTVFYGDYGTLPQKTVYGAGQAISRASFPQYLAAVTRAQTATLTSGNATITSVANTAGLGAGQPIEGIGVQSNTTIVSVTASTIVMSKTATVNGSQTVTAFLTGYGAGGDATTVGVKDCRGRVMAGRDDLNGTPAGRLTTAGFGAGATTLNASGNSLESFTMALGNMIAHNHGVFLRDPGHSHTANQPTQSRNDGTSTQSFFAFAQLQPTSTNTTGITIGSVPGVANDNSTTVTGSASPTPMRTVQPTVISDCVVAVLP